MMANSREATKVSLEAVVLSAAAEDTIRIVPAILSTACLDSTTTREISFVVAVCSSTAAAIIPAIPLSFSTDAEMSPIASTALFVSP